MPLLGRPGGRRPYSFPIRPTQTIATTAWRFLFGVAHLPFWATNVDTNTDRVTTFLAAHPGTFFCNAFGATDSHTSLSTAEEENFFGKSASAEPSVRRVEHPFASSDLGAWEGYQLAAAGYQGLWATENTREALFDAMKRKETYATTGPRMTVRFFGGWEFDDNDLRSRAPAFSGYEKGVPMGGDLTDGPGGQAPTFMVYALRDPIGANLDRIQIIKGWVDSSGQTQERIYDVAVSDGRQIGADGRARTPVGNTVDLEAANWTNTIGASELAAVWTDPNFNSEEQAFYYARVLEIPTPRWVLYDKVRLGAEIPEEAELIHQERAYTSPIWYTPE